MVSLLAALIACALVVAQIVFSGAPLFHTWQYAFALAILGWLLIAQAAREVRSAEGRGGRWIALGLLGALIVVADGMASGLVGPDTERVAHAPGSIMPLPGVGAAFFSSADPRAIEAGEASVTLRRRNHRDIVVTPGSRKFVGALMLLAQPMPAAYIEASDARGNHLTVTQPSGGSFLSPVLLFHDRQPIAGSIHPIDAFALPAAQRSLKVVYLSADDVSRLHVPLTPHAAGASAILYDVFDESGNHSLAIGVAASGEETTLAGVHLRATLGRYPQLVIASVPQPYVLLLGLGLIALGLGTSAFLAKSVPARSNTEPATRTEERAIL